MTIEEAIKWMIDTRIGAKFQGDKKVEAVCDMAIDALRTQKEEKEPKPLVPCDLCKHNPPSGFDGKPCSMCPAEAAYKQEDD